MKNIFFLIFLLVQAAGIRAQLSVGSSGITVLSGTSFSTEGLELIPSGNFNISSNKIQRTSTPVNGTPSASISRVYLYDVPLSFNGILNLYYQPTELNGNPEASLALHYSNNGIWSALPGTVNTTNDYVSYQTPSAIVFGKLTAAPSNTLLPLLANSFSASMRTNNVLLTWQVSSNSLYKGFQLEQADANGSWKNTGYVNAVFSASDNQAYTYIDGDLDFENRLYRLRLDLKTGAASYSNVISVVNKPASNKVVVTQGSNSIDIHFTGQQPDRLFLFGANGQLYYKSQQSTSFYHIALPKGVYQLQYSIGGTTQTKQVLSR